MISCISERLRERDLKYNDQIIFKIIINCRIQENFNSGDVTNVVIAIENNRKVKLGEI